MSTATKVSEDILSTFDSVVSQGADLPIAEIKKRYEQSDYFKYRDHQIFKTVIELAVTVEMLMGDTTGPVNKIVAGLKEMYGSELIFKFGGTPDECKLHVTMWRDDATLRKNWKEYAEHEYKSTMMTAA